MYIENEAKNITPKKRKDCSSNVVDLTDITNMVGSADRVCQESKGDGTQSNKKQDLSNGNGSASKRKVQIKPLRNVNLEKVGYFEI